MLNNLKDNKKGFTLTELMISISIFVFVAVNLLQFFIFNNKNSRENKNIFIANGIASECIEAVTKMRDDNYLKNLSYINGIYSGSDHTAILIFDPNNRSFSLDFGNDNNTENISSCYNSIDNSCAIYKNKISNIFTQKRLDPGVDFEKTNFSRLIKIDSFTNYIKASCYITWKEGTSIKKMTLEKDLWNWNY